MKSKKALFAWLSNRFQKPIALGSEYVMDETFGKRSMIFIGPVDMAFGIPRLKLEAELKMAGFAVHPDYWPGSNMVEVQVSYFKGWHWDE
jgi:hypothetical protein